MVASNPADETLAPVASGDAQSAVAQIEAWFARRDPSEFDLKGCLAEIGGALEQLGALPLIQNDPLAWSLYLGMSNVHSLEELLAQTDQLNERVTQLLGARPNRGRRASIFNIGELRTGVPPREEPSEPETRARPSRVMFRL